MKRLLPILLSLVLIVTVCSLFVSAEDAKPLLLEDATWTHTDNGGMSCNAEFKEDGSVVFSGSVPNTWPSIECVFTEEQCIVVDVNRYALAYDFTVEAGCANLSLRFTQNPENPDVAFSFPFSNTSIGNVSYNVGSGDLNPGEYKGEIRLTDLIEAKTNYNNEPFNQNVVSVDGLLAFSGMQVYSVSGAIITVNRFELIEVEPKTDEPEDPNEPDVTDEPESKPESKPVSSVESSEPEATSEPEQKDDGFPIGIIIAIIAGVVVVGGGAAAAIVIRKK